MACYHPIPARQKYPGAPVQFGKHAGITGPGTKGLRPTADLHIPCGKCIGCKTDRATRWAQRCMHEASLCTHSIFLTLTYDDEHLPHDGALQPKDLQGFIKRLRRTLERTSADLKSDRGNRIRFFACGEYGEINDRPHYHALIFGLDVRDSQRAGADLYASPRLGQLWGNGLTRFGSCTAAAASYVAQYSVKAHGRSNCDADGVYRQPPFLRMSRNPAIGLDWLKRYKQDLLNGYLQSGQRKYAIPRYYLDKLKQIDGLTRDDVIEARHTQRTYFASWRGGPKTAADQDRELLAREHIHQRRKQLNRKRS